MCCPVETENVRVRVFEIDPKFLKGWRGLLFGRFLDKLPLSAMRYFHLDVSCGVEVKPRPAGVVLWMTPREAKSLQDLGVQLTARRSEESSCGRTFTLALNHENFLLAA